MKHQITPDMVDSFKRMLLSKDSGDSKIALEILDNRDLEDNQTIQCFDEIKKLIVDNSQIFPRYGEVWAIMLGDIPLKMTKTATFRSKKSATLSLAYHLRKMFDWGGKENYFKTLKTIFTDVKTFQKFLLDNKIIEIKKLG